MARVSDKASGGGTAFGVLAIDARGAGSKWLLVGARILSAVLCSICISTAGSRVAAAAAATETTGDVLHVDDSFLTNLDAPIVSADSDYVHLTISSRQ